MFSLQQELSFCVDEIIPLNLPKLLNRSEYRQFWSKWDPGVLSISSGLVLDVDSFLSFLNASVGSF